MSRLQEFRTEKDQFFRTHPHSPLSPEQQHDFRGLDYFDENPDLQLKVMIEVFDTHESIHIPTSTGDFRDCVTSIAEVSSPRYRWSHRRVTPIQLPLSISNTRNVGNARISLPSSSRVAISWNEDRISNSCRVSFCATVGFSLSAGFFSAAGGGVDS